jgi:hypothetical protein
MADIAADRFPVRSSFEIRQGEIPPTVPAPESDGAIRPRFPPGWPPAPSSKGSWQTRPRSPRDRNSGFPSARRKFNHPSCRLARLNRAEPERLRPKSVSPGTSPCVQSRFDSFKVLPCRRKTKIPNPRRTGAYSPPPTGAWFWRPDKVRQRPPNLPSNTSVVGIGILSMPMCGGAVIRRKTPRT